MRFTANLFEWKGHALLLGSFIFSLLFFNHYSADLYFSFIGAIFTAFMVWGSYIIIRLIILASIRKE